MNRDVEIRLTQDEALVLCEFFSRFQRTDDLQLTNNAEFIALSEIAAQIEETLVQPFQPDYLALLTAAQDRLAQGYEGLAPGVNAQSTR